MNGIDAGSLRQLFEHLGIEPRYLMPSLAAWQIQEHRHEDRLPEAITVSIDRFRGMALMSRDYLQIGVFEFFVGLDFLPGGRPVDAARQFESARRQWMFIDHLPLICLAHLAEGVALQAAGQHHRAKAAYFKAADFLRQAEFEQHRVEKIEAERSLQAFWNDFSRVLILAIDLLEQDFNMKQRDRLQKGLGGVFEATAYKNGDEANGDADAPGLIVEMQPGQAMSATDVQELLYRTVDAIDRLCAAMRSPHEDEPSSLPEVATINYGGGQMTIELSNVSPYVVAFCRWLATTIPDVSPSGEAHAESPAETIEGLPGEPESKGNERFQAWFKLQVQSGRLAGLMRSYLKALSKQEPDESDLERLVQAVTHLAELTVNCQLRFVEGTC